MKLSLHFGMKYSLAIASISSTNVGFHHHKKEKEVNFFTCNFRYRGSSWRVDTGRLLLAEYIRTRQVAVSVGRI